MGLCLLGQVCKKPQKRGIWMQKSSPSHNGTGNFSTQRALPVCLEKLSCWKVNLHPNPENLGTSTGCPT
ncbi:hypothetical protein AMECASPLE_014774 [Ameca splendens]|uniref:Uncharacterized protein n=1 Tax=Ameca splendens TaxID=208324 RepID=A0ABV1AA69_9TELE